MHGLSQLCDSHLVPFSLTCNCEHLEKNRSSNGCTHAGQSARAHLFTARAAAGAVVVCANSNSSSKRSHRVNTSSTQDCFSILAAGFVEHQHSFSPVFCHTQHSCRIPSQPSNLASHKHMRTPPQTPHKYHSPLPLHPFPLPPLSHAPPTASGTSPPSTASLNPVSPRRV